MVTRIFFSKYCTLKELPRVAAFPPCGYDSFLQLATASMREDYEIAEEMRRKNMVEWLLITFLVGIQLGQWLAVLALARLMRNEP